jgi:hypothetical protein
MAAMLRLLSDEDVPGDIVVGLRERQPSLDIVRVQEVGLMSVADAGVLKWAAQERRQVFTRDRNTMTAAAWDRVARSLPMPGVFVIPEDMAIGRAVRELEFIALASQSDEWEGRVVYLPL